MVAMTVKNWARGSENHSCHIRKWLSGGAHPRTAKLQSMGKKFGGGGDVGGLRRRHPGYRCHDGFAANPRHGSHRSMLTLTIRGRRTKKEKKHGRLGNPSTQTCDDHH